MGLEWLAGSRGQEEKGGMGRGRGVVGIWCGYVWGRVGRGRIGRGLEELGLGWGGGMSGEGGTEGGDWVGARYGMRRGGVVLGRGR